MAIRPKSHQNSCTFRSAARRSSPPPFVEPGQELHIGVMLPCLKVIAYGVTPTGNYWLTLDLPVTFSTTHANRLGFVMAAPRFVPGRSAPPYLLRPAESAIPLIQSQ